MDERLIKTVDLKNGLRLEILESSRNLPGDRWEVVLTTMIKIPVNILSPADDTQAALNVDEVRPSTEESVCFEQKRERNFIDAKEKDEILSNVIESFSFSSLDYVSNPDFLKRCIIRQNKEYWSRKSSYPDERNVIDK